MSSWPPEKLAPHRSLWNLAFVGSPNMHQNSDSGAVMVDGGRGDFLIVVDFQMILLEMGVLVHPQLGLLFGAALPVAFLIRKKSLVIKAHVFIYFV